MPESVPNLSTNKSTNNNNDYKNNDYKNKKKFYYNKNKFSNPYKTLYLITFYVCILLLSLITSSNFIEYKNAHISFGGLIATLLPVIITYIYDHHGKRFSYKIIRISLITIVICLLALIALRFTTPYEDSIISSNNFIALSFIINLKTIITIIISYLFSIWITIVIFSHLRNKNQGKFLGLRFFLPIVVASCAYITIYYSVAFFASNIIDNLVSNYVFELFIRLVLSVLYTVLIIGSQSIINRAKYLKKLKHNQGNKYNGFNGYNTKSSRNSKKDRNNQRRT